MFPPTLVCFAEAHPPLARQDSAWHIPEVLPLPLESKYSKRGLSLHSFHSAPLPCHSADGEKGTLTALPDALLFSKLSHYLSSQGEEVGSNILACEETGLRDGKRGAQVSE